MLRDRTWLKNICVKRKAKASKVPLQFDMAPRLSTEERLQRRIQRNQQRLARIRDKVEIVKPRRASRRRPRTRSSQQRRGSAMVGAPRVWDRAGTDQRRGPLVQIPIFAGGRYDTKTMKDVLQDFPSPSPAPYTDTPSPMKRPDVAGIPGRARTPADVRKKLATDAAFSSPPEKTQSIDDRVFESTSESVLGDDPRRPESSASPLTAELNALLEGGMPGASPIPKTLEPVNPVDGAPANSTRSVRRIRKQ